MTNEETKNDNGNTGKFFEPQLIKPSQNNKAQEILDDAAVFTFYIIDNSGSMNEMDGRIYVEGKIKTNSRWEEAKNKIASIIDYNIKRQQNALYILLNPKLADWQEGIDYIALYPQENDANKNKAMKNKIVEELMKDENVREDTPLTAICRKVEKMIDHYRQVLTKGSKEIMNLNIITDGEPNKKSQFERLMMNFDRDVQAQMDRSFVTINLCTGEDAMVAEFYDKLEAKAFSNEGQLGIDIIDDYTSETQEIWKYNKWLNYDYHKLHVARMAGCCNSCWDQLDEEIIGLKKPADLFNMLKDLFNLKSNDQSLMDVLTMFTSDDNQATVVNSIADTITQHQTDQPEFQVKMGTEEKPFINTDEFRKIYNSKDDNKPCQCIML